MNYDFDPFGRADAPYDGDDDPEDYDPFARPRYYDDQQSTDLDVEGTRGDLEEQEED